MNSETTEYFRGLFNFDTRARRVKYLSVITKMIGKEALSQRSVLNRTLRWARESTIHSEFSSSSGLIIRDGQDKPQVLKQYLNLLVSAGIIVFFSEHFRLTQLGSVLSNVLLPNNLETAELTVSENLFWTYTLIQKDADILNTILIQIDDTPGGSIGEYQNTFSQKHIEVINDRIEIISNSWTQQRLLERRKRLETLWQQPSRYVEHLVPPRINWLLDLGIIQFVAGSDSTSRIPRYEFSVAGANLAKEIRAASIRLPDAFPDQWLLDEFLQVYAESGILPDMLSKRKVEGVQEIIGAVVKSAYMQNRNQLVNRVPLIPVILQSAIMCMAQHNVVVSPIQITKEMEVGIKRLGGKVDKYLISRSSRINESYIALL